MRRLIAWLAQDMLVQAYLAGYRHGYRDMLEEALAHQEPQDLLGEYQVVLN